MVIDFAQPDPKLGSGIVLAKGLQAAYVLFLYMMHHCFPALSEYLVRLHINSVVHTGITSVVYAEA